MNHSSLVKKFIYKDHNLNENVKKNTLLRDYLVSLFVSNSNQPLSQNEIWEKIQNKIEVPERYLNAMLGRESDDPDWVSQKKHNRIIFKLVSNNPKKYILNDIKDRDVGKELTKFKDYTPEFLPKTTESEGRKSYVVRALESDRSLDLFLNNNFVGIGYDLNFDIKTKSRQQIQDFLVSIGGQPRSAHRITSQIELFKQIKINDIVLTPGETSIHVGVVKSDVYFEEGSYPNRVDVEWIKEIEKKLPNDSKTIFEPDNFNFETLDFGDSGQVTFLEGIILTLKEKGNVPMTAIEIYNHIEQNFDLRTSGKTPENSVSTYLLAYSDNSTVKRKRKKNLFHIVENSPKNKYILLDPNISIDKKTFQDLEKEVEIETEVDVTQDQKVKRLSANSEERVENPFRQSICVLGDPGVGKSATTIEALINDPNHSFYLNIPTDLSSSMLAKFVKGELVLNRISEMIIKAYQNPKKKYTILIDEFHKPLTIRRVNDELLQAISLKRYKERRFISSDIAETLISEKLTEDGFDEKDFTYHGNIELPRNFGFILLSSKPNVIVENDDLYDRMDIVYLRQEDRSRINSVGDLLDISIKSSADKKDFKEIIKSQSRDRDDSSYKDNLDQFLSKFNKKNESISTSVISFSDWTKI
jgi:hypothetical protein